VSDVAPFKLAVSAGHLCNLLIIAYTKRALAFPMPGGERLKLLENLNSMTDERYLTADILATIAPMSDSEIEMMDAALSLDGEGDKGGWASSRALAKTFRLFAELNPSLAAAVDKLTNYPKPIRANA